MTSLNLDTDVLRERLITKEGQVIGGTRGSLSSCAFRFQNFTQAVHKKANQSNEKEAKAALHKSATELKVALQLHDLEMKKVSLAAQAAESELQYYDQLNQETQDKISKTRQAIESLRSELISETKIRKNREEYEALAKAAVARPSTRVTKRKMDQLQKEIDEIQDKADQLDKVLDIKSKQFHLVVQSISDLKHGLLQDEDTTATTTTASSSNTEGDSPIGHLNTDEANK